MERKAFNFYKSYADIIEKLNDVQVAQFIRALIAVQFLGRNVNEIKFDDHVLDVVFSSIKYQIQQQIDGFNNKCKALKKRNKNKNKPSQAPLVAPTEAPSLQEKEKEKEKEKEEEKEEVKEKKHINTFTPNVIKRSEQNTDKPFFNFDHKSWVNISDDLKRIWSQAYPACDIDICLSQMAAWLIANPNKRKLNYTRFITNWLRREQDRGGQVKSNKVDDAEARRTRILKMIEEREKKNKIGG